MINIGKFNMMKIVRRPDFGYYLDGNTGNTNDDILLPNKNALGRDLSIGDEVEAFIYRDSSDRLVSTLRKPFATVGEIAALEVVSVTSIGAFINFGLEKDILVPFKEKLYSLEKGKKYLFYIYLDKTGRIAATTNIDKYLLADSTYALGNEVQGIVYGFQTNGSAMIAVDNMYRGVILKNEFFTRLYHGEQLALTVNKIYEDGKLGLTPRKASRTEVNELQDKILQHLKTNNGTMKYNDKSTPAEIYKVFSSSKNHFKNALGGLMKKGLIVQDPSGTRLIK